LFVFFWGGVEGAGGGGGGGCNSRVLFILAHCIGVPMFGLIVEVRGHIFCEANLAII
jgi:hypothetical protein